MKSCHSSFCPPPALLQSSVRDAAIAPELLVLAPLVAREELQPLSERLVRQLRRRD